jgi:hypothetical protein
MTVDISLISTLSKRPAVWNSALKTDQSINDPRDVYELDIHQGIKQPDLKPINLSRGEREADRGGNEREVVSFRASDIHLGI